jgi:uncharacterized protein involved in exopolysaccharide biosynthesis
MEENSLMPIENRAPAHTLSFVNLVTAGFRWRKRMTVVFAVTVVGGLLAAFYFREYESEMKILLKKERVDLVPPERTGVETRQDLSEEELNTEVELLRSDDVLRNVVHSVRLHEKTSEPLWLRLSREKIGNSDEVRTAKAQRRLNAVLEITLPNKSNMITVRYRSADTRFATEVLTALSRIYLEKHMSVRRSPGQFRFFSQQAEQYREKLAQAEARLASFPRLTGAVEGRMELDLTEKRLSDLKLAQHQSHAAIEEAQRRIGNLEVQLASASPRMTTAVRTADNEYLMMQLKTTLLNLELKRTGLLKKFQPAHREVQEVDREISQTRASIEAAESAPHRDETTDRDPTYEWIRSELAKGRADLQSQKAKAASLKTSIAEHERETRRLNEASIQQQTLLREAKTLEESYQLYLRKREEARISDALDRNKILNVSIVQQPTSPVLPRRSPWIIVLAGVVFALVLSVGTAFISEHLDDSFRTTDEIQWYLDLPVLAALPGGAKRQLEYGSPRTISP